MLDLIYNLVDISPIEAGYLQLEYQFIELNYFLTQCYPSNRLLTNAKSITSRLDLEEGLPTVRLNSNRIKWPSTISFQML